MSCIRMDPDTRRGGRLPRTLLLLVLLALPLGGSLQAQGPDYDRIEEEVVRQAAAVKAGEEATEALLQEYRDKLEADRNDVATRFYYGNLLGMLDRTDDARVQMDRVVEREPTFVPAYHRKASYLKARGHIVEAIQELNRALEFDANYVEANKLLAEIYLNLRNEPDKAEPLLQRVLLVRPDSRSAHYRLGKIRFDQAEDLRSNGKEEEAKRCLDEAQQHFSTVMKVSPEAVDLMAGLNYFYLGHCHLQLSQPEEAYAAFGFAMKLLPPSAEAENARQNRQILAKRLGRDFIWDLVRAGVLADLKSEQPDTRLRGASTLCGHYQQSGNADALATMVELLLRPHQDLQVRILMARKLGKDDLPPELARQAGDALCKALAQDESDLVRAAAAYGLAALGSRERIPALIDALDCEDRYLCEQVLRALQSLAGTDRPTRDVVEVVSEESCFEAREQLQSAWRQWWENGGGE